MRTSAIRTWIQLDLTIFSRETHPARAIVMNGIALTHDRRTGNRIRSNTRITGAWINRNTAIFALVILIALAMKTADRIDALSTIFAWFYFQQTFIDIFGARRWFSETSWANSLFSAGSLTGTGLWRAWIRTCRSGIIS